MPLLPLLATLALAEPLPIDEVPRQVEGDPFAMMTIGVGASAHLSPNRWPVPVGGGAFTDATAPALPQLHAEIGALHFHGHAEIWIGFPVFSPERPLDGVDRAASSSWLVATGVRAYPWKLRPKTVRPYVSTDYAFRTVCLSKGDSPAESPGCVDRTVLPVGIGATWRAPLGLLVDAAVQWQETAATPLYSGMRASPLGGGWDAAGERAFDPGGLTVGLGLRAVFDTSSPVVLPGWREAEAARIARLEEAGLMSTLELGLAPSSRIWRIPSAYWRDERPWLRDAVGEGVFPHLTAGWYDFPTDSVVRVGWRRIHAHAEGYGVTHDAVQNGVFLEAFKLFDPDFHGFVPFVGGGVGWSWLSLEDAAGGEVVRAEASRPTPSAVVGWDIRMDPSNWWVLRTSLRVVPWAPVETGDGVRFDFGGVEYDFIQLVVKPARIGRRAS